ncbi:hypothetical protein AAFF_G00085620 [Aldrovandia affinis]|uniref:Deleted in malignant brain tumors 1 protein-like n=1 Tax=Aldrovandia affinis TaxID=143900 RepID=A0AAD7RX41_9TELE|nr:hypothetical protein AAFF_G00085620 [Aldrovandia affinis]
MGIKTATFLLCSLVALRSAQGWYTTNEASTRQHVACGGELTASRGEFSSPNYPRTYPPNAHCQWRIQTSGSRTVNLNFTDFGLERDVPCRYDSVSVYDGPSASYPMLGKFCGSGTPSVSSTGTYMTVIFISDSSDNFQGFRAEYSIEESCRSNCGSSFGSCSCSYNCPYYGNCCHDYHDYCGTTTAEPQAPTTAPTTDYGSCRDNCGFNVGSCNCWDDCPYNWNCCPDYNDYGSCRHNCGYHVGSCSCWDNCRYYGNCCRDYYDYCGTRTAEPTAPTTGQGSCRYNCGSHVGSCSCSYNCRYYGNCCRDYYDYCGTTTAEPQVTTGQESCRYNCGSSFRNCSCSYNCPYYGNCCHDYYNYCGATTQDPQGTPGYSSCGGNLHGSGSFSSPNYPNYYHDNHYCTWQISAPSGQRIFLAITDLELENCCACDYIAVYDGPSTGYPSLGKVCSNPGGDNGTDSFHSSSRYMTVLFRTDSSVVGRGFRAEYSSSLSVSSGRVDCSSDDMNIVIQNSYLSSMGYSGHDLYVDDQHCRPRVLSHQVVFSFTLNTCGTRREFHNGRVVYRNSVRAYRSNNGEITRQSPFLLHVFCRMEKDTVAQNMYEARNIIDGELTGVGRFNATMAFYTSSNFYYPVTQSPYVVDLNAYIYTQVRLRRQDSALVLFLDTCSASPSPHDFSRSYDLVRDGCRQDSSYYAYASGNREVAQFRFQAFQFLRTHNNVYLQCKVIICKAHDYNSRCTQGCRSRVARDLQSDSEHETATVILGPIQRRGGSKGEEKPVLQEEPLEKAVIQEEPLEKAVIQEEPLEKAVIQEEPLEKAVIQEEPLEKAVIQEEPLEKAVLQAEVSH